MDGRCLHTHKEFAQYYEAEEFSSLPTISLRILLKQLAKREATLTERLLFAT